MTEQFTSSQIGQLNQMLDSSNVRQREQGGRKLDYIEGWHAIAEANQIFGFGGWNRETIYCRETSRQDTVIGQYKKPGWKITYKAKVRITVGSVVREGTGHGSGIMSDLGDAIESAAKEAETDAMKRALMTFGNRFGLALYDKEKRNVEDTAAEPQKSVVKSEPQPEKRPSPPATPKYPVMKAVPIPVLSDGSGSDWQTYGANMIAAIKALKTKGEFLAFREINDPGLNKLTEDAPDIRTHVSIIAAQITKENGWNKQQPKAPIPSANSYAQEYHA